MTAYLTGEQIGQLLKPINPTRVGQDDAGYSHLQAYDVRAHLNRCFGFARWSAELLDLVALYEEPCTLKNGKPGFKTAYRATLRLSVCAPDGTHLASYTEAAVGESTMPDFKRGDCADMAIKTAESQALKRCAANLGDQFGLSLYRKGSTAPLVMRTLVMPDGLALPGTVDEGTPEIVPEHLPETSPDPIPATDGSGEPAPDPAPAPDPRVDQVPVEAVVKALRTAVAEALELQPLHGLQKLGRIKMQAGKEKLLNEPVESWDGKPTTVAVLVDEATKVLSRAS